MKLTKKCFALLLFLAFVVSSISPVSASVKAIKPSIEIESILNEYFDALIAKRADLSTEKVDLREKDFYIIDRIISNWISLNLSSNEVDLRYQNYSSKKTFQIEYIDEATAVVGAYIGCNFSYMYSPNEKSKIELWYKVVLNNNDGWEIVSRTYPSNLEKLFWGGDEVSVENALIKYNQLLEAVSKPTCIEDGEFNKEKPTPNAVMSNKPINSRTLVPYDRTGAAEIAIDYVSSNPSAPNGYAYPTGYHSRAHDCTNFVSFCLNYGGGIPQDFSGSYKWHTGATASNDTSSWINVDSFYTYLMNSTQDSTGGIVAAQIYSASTYPSSSYLNQLEKGDVIQFSSNGGGNDWTHSVIVNKVSGGVHICGHSAGSSYNNCYLSEFYNHYASLNQSYYIRLIKIAGYRA